MVTIRHIHIILLCCCGYTKAYACDVGWFGPVCQYQCHCENTQCDHDGNCINSAKCTSGWFGYKCQYYDLVVNATNFKDLPTWLTDNDQNTCNTMSDVFPSISLRWNKMYLFRYLRLAVKHKISDTDIGLQFYTNESIEVNCTDFHYVLINERTLDIHCGDRNSAIEHILVRGKGIKDLCSIHLSGGRNVALKQRTYQTSNYTAFTSSAKAVEGDTSQRLNSLDSSCTHTAALSTPPSWTITFTNTLTIDRIVIYNRADCCSQRLSNFTLQAFGEKKELVFHYTDSRTLLMYEVIDIRSLTIKSISITANYKDKEVGKKIILSLCEVQTYGDCPRGKWGLECDRNCPTECLDWCNVQDGTCDTRCVGYSNPPYCNQVCEPGRWGLNCTKYCSTKCNGTCNRMNGLCDGGCLGFSNPPACTQKCDSGRWGPNCSRACSYRCFGRCNSLNGVCDEGCLGFENPPTCNISCVKGLYGMNCSLPCSNICNNSDCHPVTGQCLSCRQGLEGHYCHKVGSKFNIESFGLGFGTGLGILFVLVVIIVTVCVWCKHTRLSSRLTQSSDRMTFQVKTIYSETHAHGANFYVTKHDWLQQKSGRAI
ncbi:uncharacterized protein LOC106061757 isoform X2 [Biomphalaria glabrata]|uniref:Uncharacterized protein LOC106061757 isoform X2 n=1 Tax=Biomphalaria glabrata TaxID=6526 RepID=A0A9W3AFY8_BIOGL|nr:uncharacterized protein LOC106061757 isoform X2 [Biomphalaria glabrata]